MRVSAPNPRRITSSPRNAKLHDLGSGITGLSVPGLAVLYVLPRPFQTLFFFILPRPCRTKTHIPGYRSQPLTALAPHISRGWYGYVRPRLLPSGHDAMEFFRLIVLQLHTPMFIRVKIWRREW